MNEISKARVALRRLTIGSSEWWAALDRLRSLEQKQKSK
jgi:hypothetical protein